MKITRRRDPDALRAAATSRPTWPGPTTCSARPTRPGPSWRSCPRCSTPATACCPTTARRPRVATARPSATSRCGPGSGAWRSPAGSSSGTATTSTTRSPSPRPTARSTSTASATWSSGSGSGSGPGREPLVVATPWGRVGFAVCADMIYRKVWDDYRGRIDLAIVALGLAATSPTATRAGSTGCSATSGRSRGRSPARWRSTWASRWSSPTSAATTQTVIPILGTRITDRFAGLSSICDGRHGPPIAGRARRAGPALDPHHPPIPRTSHMAFYVNLGPRGLLFRAGTILIGVLRLLGLLAGQPSPWHDGSTAAPGRRSCVDEFEARSAVRWDQRLTVRPIDPPIVDRPWESTESCAESPGRLDRERSSRVLRPPAPGHDRRDRPPGARRRAVPRRARRDPGARRLSIVDLAGGRQPIPNEDGSIWVAFNGELFEYPELRQELLAKGHTLATRCDTEAWVHLYEDLGEGMFAKARGQFAVSLWDRTEQHPDPRPRPRRDLPALLRRARRLAALGLGDQGDPGLGDGPGPARRRRGSTTSSPSSARGRPGPTSRGSSRSRPATTSRSRTASSRSTSTGTSTSPTPARSAGSTTRPRWSTSSST